MRAGMLKHSIVIQEKTVVPDGMGSSTESWSTFSTVWAGVWPVSAKELVQQQQNEHEITHRVRMRYVEGLTPDMRILFGSRVFEIISAINTDERNVSHDLLCTEVTA